MTLLDSYLYDKERLFLTAKKKKFIYILI